jgi:CubicO group peptidase (beta-lactamase class C family)
MMCHRESVPCKAVVLWVFLGLLTIVFASATDSLAKEADASNDTAIHLDQYLQREVREHAFSGAVLVAQSGRVLLSKGYGKANIEWDTSNTSVTKFRIGSLTKQFTATALLQLREKGALQLSDSVCKHLQPCPAVWRSITLHHLLSHTSGIPGYPSIVKLSVPNGTRGAGKSGFEVSVRVVKKRAEAPNGNGAVIYFEYSQNKVTRV